MRKKMKRWLYALMAAAVMLGGIQMPVAVKAQESGKAARSGVTVTTQEQFMAALQNHQTSITVDGNITISGGTDTDKRMLPVVIPGGTMIRGTEGSSIVSRGPIQLEGDNVCFQDIKLTFNSSNGLGSVAHREIFLAGHSLTLDNVSTYLEGADGSLGGLGGTEKELLPTIYAGGYTGTDVGNNASLTVTDSNSETIIKAIYMGHNEGDDNKIPYKGNAVLNLDANAGIREEIDASWNNQAKISITGGVNDVAKAKQFYGNENTTLEISAVSVEDVLIDNVNNIILKDKARLAPQTEALKNVTLQNGACLDFNGVINAVISGDFVSEAHSAGERGKLVLNKSGSVTISGKVTGTTQFQTGSYAVPGMLIDNQTYIYAQAGNGSEPNFVLPQASIDNGFNLKYTSGEWVVYKGTADPWVIGDIRVLSAPVNVDLDKITQKTDGVIPDEDIYFEVKWYNGSGIQFDDADIEDYGYYGESYVIPIRTEYWESSEADIQGKTDWRQMVSLMRSDTHLGKYFLQAQPEAKTGDYTFLFCSDYLDEDVQPTVADVKMLKTRGEVKAEKRVIFYDQNHSHVYEGVETEPPTCIDKGIKTFTCSICGDTYTEEIERLAHTVVTDPAVEPTETTEGKTEGSHCSVCGTVLKEQEIIPATGKTEEEHKHTYTSKVTKAATCTDKGIKTFTCSVCEDTYTEDIAALGHKEVTDPAVEPTETTEGKTEGSHCSVCGTVLKAQETIPVKPAEPENPDPKPPINPDPADPDPGPGTPSTHTHAYQEAITKVPTCTALGTRTFTCECGDTYTEELPMAAHQYTEKRIPAAVSSPGKVQQICSVCSAVKDEALIDGIQSFSLSRTDYVYDGKSKKPSVIIKDTKGRRLAEGADYKASYARGRINPGVYTVTVKLTGNYSGQMSGTFTIRPKKTVLRKVTPRSGGMQVTWKKNLVKTDGYQIQYSTDKKFKSPAAKVTTAKKYAVGKKISKLKPNKKYYVRIRTYKIVRTNGKSKRVYSDWSEAKTVRTKK